MIKENELAHDRKILANPDKIWGRVGSAGKKRLERRAAMIIDFSRPKPGQKVLEIGCGSGALTEKLAATGAEILATDVFPEFLKLTKKRIPAQNVLTQIADAESLAGLADCTFDAVVGLSILHHLDIDAALAAIHRVLRPGGTMTLAEPNMLNPQIALQKNIPAIKKALGDSPDETAFFAWTMRKKLAGLNFRDITIIPFDFLHPSIPDAFAAVVEEIGDILERIPFIREIAGSLFIGARK